MTVPPEHLKEPPKVTIRRKKLPVQDTTNRHLPGQNQQVVNSKEIIMATNLPVAEENRPRQQASHIAAEQDLMTGRKEATAPSLPAKERAIHPKEKAAIRTDQIPTTGTKAVSAAVKRKASSQEIHLIQVAQPLMTNQKEAPIAIGVTANRPVKRGLILKGLLLIQEGRLLMISLKGITIANHQAKKGLM